MIQLMKSLLIASSAMLINACGEAVIGDAADFTPVVKVKPVAAEQDTEVVYFPAIARAADLTEISFRIGGEIIKLDVKDGQKVKQGDLLASLDDKDYRIAVDNAQASYEVVNSQYTRSKPLAERGLLAQSQFDEIRAKRAIAKADLDLAKLRLSFTQLQAPFDGIISRLNVDNFQNIAPGELLFNLHRIDTVEVLVQIPDRLVISYLDPKSTTKTLVKTGQGNVYESQLKEYTTEPDPTTGTYTVTLTMPMPAEEFILDGMALEATNQASDEEFRMTGLITIPIEAVVNPDGQRLDQTGNFVWLLNDDNTVKKQTVELGRVQLSTIVVNQGLAVDDTLVVAGLSQLRDGMSVNPIEHTTSLHIEDEVVSNE